MFNEFRQKIKEYDTVGVFSHVRPDGDCLGAQIGLCLWLEKNGIRALAFNDHDVPQNLDWMGKYFPVEKPDHELAAQCDLFVVVDGNAPVRFGSYQSYQNDHPRPAFMIDHHPDPKDDFQLIICEDTASSTCELIYRLYAEHDISQIDKQVAKSLYTGIVTDTGSLQFDSVTPETVEATADLLRRGNFLPSEVYDRVYSNKSPQQLKLLSLALNTIQLYENNQIAIMYVTDKMLKETNTKSEDCEGFVSYALSLEGIKAAVLLKDIDGKVRMSLRSRSNVDVNEWAKELDGGGHKKAAGASHPGPLSSAINDVVKIGVKQLKNIENENVLS